MQSFSKRLFVKGGHESANKESLRGLSAWNIALQTVLQCKPNMSNIIMNIKTNGNAVRIFEFNGNVNNYLGTWEMVQEENQAWGGLTGLALASLPGWPLDECPKPLKSVLFSRD